MTAPRIVFAGTPAFALASLRALVDAGHDIAAVYTQPDRPAGRGRKLTASAVRRYADAQGLAVRQPPTLRDSAAVDELRALQPDMMIVAAYGLILPQSVLDIPSRGCLNIHASILPRWRGAAPIQAAILAGDRETGVSLMQMTAGLDSGPVYADRRIQIGTGENAGELHDRLATLGADLLTARLPGILAGECSPVPQDEARVTYAGKISKADAELDWRLPAADLARRVRAYNPAPGAFFLQSAGAAPLRIKVWDASVVAAADGVPGSYLQYDADAIVVACGTGALRLDTLQAPGKRRATAREFVQQIDLPR